MSAGNTLQADRKRGRDDEEAIQAALLMASQHIFVFNSRKQIKPEELEFLQS